MIKIVSFSKLDQINRNTSPLLWFLNQSSLILFVPRPIISNWFDKNGKQTNPPWFNRGSNKSVARYNSRAKKSPSWRQFCPNHVHAQRGRKVVSVMQRLHGHVRLSFPRYMHINLRPPAVQDQLRSIYYRILDTFERGAAFSRVGRTDIFVQSAKRWHSILREVYGWTVSHEESCLPDSRA